MCSRHSCCGRCAAAQRQSGPGATALCQDSPLSPCAQVRLLLIEQDAFKRKKPCKSATCAALVDYALWEAKLRAEGFSRVWYAHDTFAPKTAGWSKNLFHSAWAHVAPEGAGDLCSEYKTRHGLTDRQLMCAPFDA